MNDKGAYIMRGGENKLIPNNRELMRSWNSVEEYVTIYNEDMFKKNI